MEEIKTIKEKTIELIDALKATCQTYGMGNDGNEYKIITQVFLYKFLNDMSNSLVAVHPELVAEWSEKNLPLTPDNVTFGSNRFTTRMCEAGVNINVIQDALGYTDISTTLNICTDVTKELKTSEFKGLDNYFKAQ